MTAPVAPAAPAGLSPARRRQARRRRTRRWLPPQHGAWAMLLVPYLAGLLAAGFRWPDVPLLGAWLAGYLLSYQVFLAVKSRRPARYRDVILGYAAVTVPLAAVVVAARPAVLAVAPAFAALLAANAWYAYRRRERALLNDLASVAQSCLVMVVVAIVAGVPPAAVAGPLIITAGYFTGTVLYVKTMIRERDSAGYRRASIGYHAVASALGAWYGAGVAAFFGWLLIRAAVLPGRPVPVRMVGILEIVV